MAYQTRAHSDAFLMGSARMLIPSSSGGYVDLGAARGIKLTEAWDSYEIEVDNTPSVVKGIKNQTITVEGNLLELNLQKIAKMRGGIDTFSTTTFTFDSGGNMTVTPQQVTLVHTAATSSQTVTAIIYYASVTDPMAIPYVSDSGTDVAEIPFKMKGVAQSSRTVGSQLYTIIDTRSSMYTTTDYPYLATYSS